MVQKNVSQVVVVVVVQAWGAQGVDIRESDQGLGYILHLGAIGLLGLGFGEWKYFFLGG